MIHQAETPSAMTDLPKRKVVKLARGALSYREAGSGPSLLLLHGMSGGSASWVRQFQALADRYRVISWDAPGFGDSEPVEGGADAFAAQALALMRALGCGPSTVVGHSMGGIVAVRLAANHPDHVTGLVLSCTHPGYGEPPGSPLMARFTGRIEEYESLGPRDYGLLRARMMLPPNASPEVVELAACIALDMRPEGQLCAGAMMLEADNGPLLPKVTAPVLVITAELDPVVTQERWKPLVGLPPDAHHVEMTGVGHAPYLEDPWRYAELIEEFLTR